MKKMNIYNVILAGGNGTRFWPLSRESRPKQLINITGKDALINETIARVNRISDNDNLYIVTNRKQEESLKQIVKGKCKEENIILEPMGRNTTAAIGLAAITILKRRGDGIMCVYPSDHCIDNDVEFTNTINRAVRVAEQENKIVTIGIKPTYPATGYGYINYNSNKAISEVACEVLEFVEKPDFQKAKQYLNSGEYMWNSGIFIWKVSEIIKNIQRYLPKIYDKLNQISELLDEENSEEKIKQIYSEIPSISIDYGILERSDDVAVVASSFQWNDVGAWDSLGAIYPPDKNGNIIKGNDIVLETDNSIVYSEDKLITTLGVNNLIVVSTKDSVLVCAKDKAQEIKKIIDKLKENNMNEFI
ncbi:mannose-1-phosphate guanylyltransferase [Clostridium sp. OS1-26]|uniref:mannose-1-phosphate guanylyltransferase n=1 Tax=Clostridium sp. OS1-26 TaxID=3070681 RepID=UPI0027E0084A|nr:mannose-1-phosphate guanylyltransferase [Clostridium sp. OS1-26]WML35466.1 mannose-1-phosphate guanylyltransferase [Clostridium sp. OS1-26]